MPCGKREIENPNSLGLPEISFEYTDIFQLYKFAHS